MREAIEIRGVVQGVGLRPYVHALAARHHLGGFVRNRDGVVEVEVEGPAAAIDGFCRGLVALAPPLARIDHVTRTARSPLGEREFRIVASEPSARAPAVIPPDIAVCAACVAELFDPENRRFRYPFISCTACGPRLTIAKAGPYDRERTTYGAFAMCDACDRDYRDPANRRFHAQTVACAACGPSLWAERAAGERVASGERAIALAAARLVAGEIVAIKGVGGYHLAIDARSQSAAARLRSRKQRDDKPFAIMAPDVATAMRLVELDADERALLESPARPVVLARAKPGVSIAPGVAEGSHLHGVMLPASPLQHLIAAELPGVPLVMTSGNRSDEPIAHTDDDARARLWTIADLLLVHDLVIHDRCDDSIARVIAGAPRILRRARGYAPLPVAAPADLARPTLAVGAQMKSVFALASDGRAVASQHLGDLDHLAAYRAFTAAIDRFQQMTAIDPVRIVCDRHPDYASTRWAQTRAAASEGGVELMQVQHHTAHVLSCLAEHGVDSLPAIGVAFDGTGYGDDGAIWGGEILAWDGTAMQRALHLAYVPMPGGGQAIREPWRMAIAYLHAAGADVARARAPNERSRDAAIALITSRVNAPRTSSMGRLFDAIAAVVGVAPSQVSFDGQAAMKLEALAASAPQAAAAYPVTIGPKGIDAAAIVARAAADLAARTPAAVVARKFHATVVELIAAACERVRAETGVARVALSGGVFANALVLADAIARLETAGFVVHSHRNVPPGDGGLWLGQLAYAAACDRRAG